MRRQLDRSPDKLTEDLRVVTLTTLHKVLQNLLDEKCRFAICAPFSKRWRNMPIQSDPHELTAVVRVALGRAITQQWFHGKMKSMLLASIHHWSVYCYRLCKAGRTGAGWRIVYMQTQEALSRQEMLGAPPVLLVNHARPLLSRFLRRRAVSGAVESGTIR